MFLLGHSANVMIFTHTSHQLNELHNLHVDTICTSNKPKKTCEFFFIPLSFIFTTRVFTFCCMTTKLQNIVHVYHKFSQNKNGFIKIILLVYQKRKKLKKREEDKNRNSIFSPHTLRTFLHTRESIHRNTSSSCTLDHSPTQSYFTSNNKGCIENYLFL